MRAGALNLSGYLGRSTSAPHLVGDIDITGFR